MIILAKSMLEIILKIMIIVSVHFMDTECALNTMITYDIIVQFAANQFPSFFPDRRRFARWRPIGLCKQTLARFCALGHAWNMNCNGNLARSSVFVLVACVTHMSKHHMWARIFQSAGLSVVDFMGFARAREKHEKKTTARVGYALRTARAEYNVRVRCTRSGTNWLACVQLDNVRRCAAGISIYTCYVHIHACILPMHSIIASATSENPAGQQLNAECVVQCARNHRDKHCTRTM